MAASTIFQVMIFISLSICVWTLPTITKRQSDDECSDELIELLKGVEVSRMVLKNRLTRALNANKDLYQAVANISKILEHQKIISEEDDTSLAMNYILNVTLKPAASQWIHNTISYDYSFSYTTQEGVYQIMLMTESHAIITTLYSELKNYKKCREVNQCQWIDYHILNNSSVPDCVQQYIVDHGPGHCKDTNVTTRRWPC